MLPLAVLASGAVASVEAIAETTLTTVRLCECGEWNYRGFLLGGRKSGTRLRFGLCLGLCLGLTFGCDCVGGVSTTTSASNAIELLLASLLFLAYTRRLLEAFAGGKHNRNTDLLETHLCRRRQCPFPFFCFP